MSSKPTLGSRLGGSCPPDRHTSATWSPLLASTYTASGGPTVWSVGTATGRPRAAPASASDDSLPRPRFQPGSLGVALGMALGEARPDGSVVAVAAEGAAGGWPNVMRRPGRPSPTAAA